jgi:hypothetical protein
LSIVLYRRNWSPDVQRLGKSSLMFRYDILKRTETLAPDALPMRFRRIFRYHHLTAWTISGLPQAACKVVRFSTRTYIAVPFPLKNRTTSTSKGVVGTGEIVISHSSSIRTALSSIIPWAMCYTRGSPILPQVLNDHWRNGHHVGWEIETTGSKKYNRHKVQRLDQGPPLLR